MQKLWISFFCHTVEYEHSSSDNESNNNGLDVTIPQTIEKYKSKYQVVERQNFLDNLCKVYTPEVIDSIEKKTRQQSGCDDWYVHRKGRITASVMGSVLNCNMEKLSDDNYIVKKVQCSSENVSQPKQQNMAKQWKVLQETSTVKCILNHV